MFGQFNINALSVKRIVFTMVGLMVTASVAQDAARSNERQNTVRVSASKGSAQAQDSTTHQEPEQTVFNAEPDSAGKLVTRPAKIPDSALDALRDTITGGDLNCLRAMGTTPAQAEASWFLASEVHLSGPNEIDLIVLLNVPNIARPTNPGGCLLGANSGPFWVLRPGIATGKYRLLLEAYAGSLEVLGSRTNRYRDIRTGHGSLSGSTTVLYKFMASQYQFAEKKTEPPD